MNFINPVGRTADSGPQARACACTGNMSHANNATLTQGMVSCNFCNCNCAGGASSPAHNRARDTNFVTTIVHPT